MNYISEKSSLSLVGVDAHIVMDAHIVIVTVVVSYCLQRREPLGQAQAVE